jgi:hypothetical protein
LVRDRSGRAVREPSLSDAVLIGIPVLHPGIASARLEWLGETQFRGAAITALASALTSALAENPATTSPELRDHLIAAGHGPSLDSVLGKLQRTGLGGLAAADPDYAAKVWDDAAHLRLRAGALSIERQAAAQALGREASDFHLVRLRDIQEQDQRNLRPDDRGETEEAGIVHPFKGR